MRGRDILREIISDSIEKDFKHILPREVTCPLDVPKIISLVGARRTGKTSLCYNAINRLRKTVGPERALYVNFEDDRLYPATISVVDELIRVYFEMYPENKNRLTYFFFDEVQEAPNWEKFVRKLIDQENCRIFITGSSSGLLGKELATSLRGRTLPVQVFPLSFSEFLKFNNVQFSGTHSSKDKAALKGRLNTYLYQGGFPELLNIPEQYHRSTISEYINIMLYRDISERYGIRNTSLMKYLLKYTINNISNLMAPHKVFRDLKSQGFSLSKNTLYDYLSYLEDALVVYRVQKWDRSVRKQAVNPDKIYVLDPSLKYAMFVRGDEGRALENVIFMELVRRGREIHYYKEGQEVDFLIDEKELINVCLDLSDFQTRQREIAGLATAMKTLGINESVLINWSEEGELDTGAGTVQFVPAYRFLLGH